MTRKGSAGQVRPLRWPQVLARRLERHALTTPLAGRDPAAAAALIGGAHAQVGSAAELSLALRCVDITRVDVRDALWRDRRLVKAHGPRGTVHLLATTDLPMWTGALAALPSGPSPFDARVRLTDTQRDAVVVAIGESVREAELTVDELDAAVVAAVGGWAGERVMPAFQELWPRWRQALSVAAHRGVVCFGAPRGRRPTYTSPARLLPGFAPMPGPAALAELVRRYLHAYGPATPAHFAQWLGAPRAWVTTLFASLGDELVEVDVDGTPAWTSADESFEPAGPARGVWLLPYFDAYVVGSHPRDVLFAGEAGKRALAGGQAGNFPVLVVDGAVAGVWSQHRTGRRIQLTVEPLRRLTIGQRHELEGQAHRIGEILEGTATLVIDTVTVGPHA